MVKSEKTFNKILLVSAIAAGGYALLKGLSNSSADTTGEGSLGGEDEQLENEDYFDDKFEDEIGFQSIADPNTIPEQPTALDPYIPQLPTTPNIPSVGDTSPRSPTTNDFVGATNPSSNTPETAPAGIFGDLTTPQVVGLGAASFLPTVFTSAGKLGVSQADDTFFSLFKKALPDAVSETPFVGKQLNEFAFKQADDVAFDFAKYGIKNVVPDVAEGAVKAGSKSFI